MRGEDGRNTEKDIDSRNTLRQEMYVIPRHAQSMSENPFCLVSRRTADMREKIRIDHWNRCISLLLIAMLHRLQAQLPGTPPILNLFCVNVKSRNAKME